MLYWLSMRAKAEVKGCVPDTEQVLTRCPNGNPSTVLRCGSDGQTWNEFTYTCPTLEPDGMQRINFNYIPEIVGGDITYFRMPKSGYTTKTFLEELKQINSGDIVSVSIWRSPLWDSYLFSGVGKNVIININDIVKVAVNREGCYWEYN